MVQAPFFTQQINRRTPSKENSAMYYIPIVADLQNLQKPQAWNYARNPRVARMFYTSIDDLFAQEGLQAGREHLNCYKISLTPAQIILLNESKRLGSGYLLALSFSPQEILSCTKLVPNEHIEFINPFYTPQEAPARAYSAASIGA